MSTKTTIIYINNIHKQPLNNQPYNKLGEN